MESKYPRMVILQQRSLAVIRMFMGFYFLYAVSAKLSPAWVASFPKQVTLLAQSHAPGFYASLLTDVVLPSAPAFAYGVILGELAVGLALLLGLFTAPFAVLGAFLSFNFLLATGSASLAQHLVFMVVQLGLGFGFAGTTWGLDRFLIDKMPWWGQGLLHYEYREF